MTFLLPPHERIQRAVAFWQRIEQKALTGAPLDQADADEIALLQIGGIDVESKHYDFKMPEFSQLDDAALAAALNFVVFDLGHAAEGTKPLQPAEIAAERANPLDGPAVREHRTKVLTALGL